MNPTWQSGDVTLYLGDSPEIMRGMEPNSVDAIVTDPPYGLEFMGKEWDRLWNDQGGDETRSAGRSARKFQAASPPYQAGAAAQSWHYAWAVEALRVAKPGAHLLAFGGTRTWHRLACALEDAGWEIRDTVMWVYGSGFPKSHDISKAIDREAGADREVVGYDTGVYPDSDKWGSSENQGGRIFNKGTDTFGPTPITAPATPEAARWQGWGTGLKPAWEPILVCRKPPNCTIAANVLKWGTGGINVDGCRVETAEDCARKPSELKPGAIGYLRDDRPMLGGNGSPLGRWPANLIHDGSDEVLAGFPSVNGPWAGNGTRSRRGATSMFGIGGNCDNERYKGSGSAARFFYCAKASKQDRDEGCEGMPEGEAHATHINQTRPVCNICGCGTIIAGPGKRMACGHTNIRFEPSVKDKHGKEEGRRNHHPTVKPAALMRYLCRLVTPPGGIILDPFMGSGSTGKAAVLEGFGFVGIDREVEYIEIARARIGCAAAQARMAL